jgi:hypothetical protein
MAECTADVLPASRVIGDEPASAVYIGPWQAWG